MNIFDELPDIQQKYINKELFRRALEYVQRARGDQERVTRDILGNKYISNNEKRNLIRYSKLILKYF
jgi:hypothetical protein